MVMCSETASALAPSVLAPISNHMTNKTDKKPNAAETARLAREKTTMFAKEAAAKEKKLRDEKTARLRAMRLAKVGEASPE